MTTFVYLHLFIYLFKLQTIEIPINCLTKKLNLIFQKNNITTNTLISLLSND